MGFSLTVKVDGINQLDRMITNVSELPKDLTPYWKEVRTVVQEAIAKNFEGEGRANTWQELSERTVLDRLSQGYDEGPIGVRDGNMKTSLIGDGDDTINNIQPQSAEFGATGVKVASFHRGRGGNTTQPARNVLYMDEEDKNKIVRVFRMAVQSSLTKSPSQFFGG